MLLLNLVEFLELKLSVSNILWNPTDDEIISQFLVSHEISYIDVALTKYFPDLTSVTDAQVERLRTWWNSRGIYFYGVQSLLYHRSDLNLFKSASDRFKMLTYLDLVFRLSSQLGCQRLVFGSPFSRNYHDKTQKVVRDIALNFFSSVGDLVSKYKMVFCIEACPRLYNSNFLTTTTDVIDFVGELNHPSVKANLDTGALIINMEDPLSIISSSPECFGHFHLSQPNLNTLGDYEDVHQIVSSMLYKFDCFSNSILAIETIKQDQSDLLASLSKSIEFVKKIYTIS